MSKGELKRENGNENNGGGKGARENLPEIGGKTVDEKTLRPES